MKWPTISTLCFIAASLVGQAVGKPSTTATCETYWEYQLTPRSPVPTTYRTKFVYLTITTTTSTTVSTVTSVHTVYSSVTLPPPTLYSWITSASSTVTLPTPSGFIPATSPRTLKQYPYSVICTNATTTQSHHKQTDLEFAYTTISPSSPSTTTHTFTFQTTDPTKTVVSTIHTTAATAWAACGPDNVVSMINDQYIRDTIPILPPGEIGRNHYAYFFLGPSSGAYSALTSSGAVEDVQNRGAYQSPEDCCSAVMANHYVNGIPGACSGPGAFPTGCPDHHSFPLWQWSASSGCGVIHVYHQPDVVPWLFSLSGPQSGLIYAGNGPDGVPYVL